MADTSDLLLEGIQAARAGDHEEARDVLQRAVGFDPHQGSAHYGLGRVYGELGDFERAVDSLRLAVHYLPDKAQPYVWLGKSLAMVGRFDEAAGALEVAVKLEPANVTAVELLQHRGRPFGHVVLDGVARGEAAAAGCRATGRPARRSVGLLIPRLTTEAAGAAIIVRTEYNRVALFPEW